MLGGLLVHSADNYADLLATWDAGSMPAFVAKMNAAAARLGMDHSHFADASGVDPGSQSTASDLLKVAALDMANPTFAVDGEDVVGHACRSPGRSRPTRRCSACPGGDRREVRVHRRRRAGVTCWRSTRTVHGKQVLLLAAVTGQTGPDRAGPGWDCTPWRSSMRWPAVHRLHRGAAGEAGGGPCQRVGYHPRAARRRRRPRADLARRHRYADASCRLGRSRRRLVGARGSGQSSSPSAPRRSPCRSGSPVTSRRRRCSIASSDSPSLTPCAPGPLRRRPTSGRVSTRLAVALDCYVSVEVEEAPSLRVHSEGEGAGLFDDASHLAAACRAPRSWATTASP